MTFALVGPVWNRRRYLRFSPDPRVLVLVLGGLASSLVLSAEPGGAREGRDDLLLWNDKSSETLPRLLDPGVSPIAVQPSAVDPSAVDPWYVGSLQYPGGLPPPRSESAEALASTDLASSVPAPAADDPGNECPFGMILVEGNYCPILGHVCLKWLKGEVERCAEYRAPAVCVGVLQKKRFCIDRFEYPNLEGVLPAIMISWHEAQAACETEGKRLCTASEWTLACEGKEMVPYPYGYTRDSSACNIDQPQADVDPLALQNPRQVATEVARLDRRARSGDMARCKSPYGVQDMTGNVDEWVVSDQHLAPASGDGGEKPFISALKGGYWGPVRNRCRATTTAHNEWFRYYDLGFRCCADAP